MELYMGILPVTICQALSKHFTVSPDLLLSFIPLILTDVLGCRVIPVLQMRKLRQRV